MRSSRGLEPDAVITRGAFHALRRAVARPEQRLADRAENECRVAPRVAVISPTRPPGRALRAESLYTRMVDKGPLLTSAIIFYLSIGAAIFQVLEEPNWKAAAKRYRDQKDTILKDYPCLTKDDLDKILEVCFYYNFSAS